MVDLQMLGLFWDRALRRAVEHRSDQSLGPLTGTLGGPPAVRTGGHLPGRDNDG